MVEANAKGPLSEKAYLDALGQDHRLSRDDQHVVMKTHHIDAIVARPSHRPCMVDGFC